MKKLYFFSFFAASLMATAQPVTFTMQSFGSNNYNACTVDMTGDYLDDIVVIAPGNLVVYKQLSEGGFEQINYPVAGLGFGAATPDWSIAAGDFDANGFNDLVLGNGSRISVLKANATGTGYALLTYPQNIFSQRTNFVDINNDGDLDLFACHDVDQSHVYRNDGAGNLIFDQSLMPTLDVGGNYASAWTDYDNDGDFDMYLAKCRGGAPVGDPQRINLLYTNNGDGTFTEDAAAAGINDGAQSWSSAWADFDNDGDMDCLLSNITDQNRLYRNNGDGTFTDIYASTGIAPQVGSWEVQAADFNNDGWIDFFWQNGKELYLNNGNMTFTGYDLSFNQGGVADFNNDGFLDVQSGNNVFYNSGNENNWLKVRLQGVLSNRNGIGARIEIHGSWGVQIREVRSGEGFANMSSLNVHFGLGTASEITSVVVRWPSGTVDVIENPASNESLFVLEGSSPQLGLPTQQDFHLSLYPNPAGKQIHFGVGAENEIVAAEIFDITGKQLLSSKVKGQMLSVENLQAGTYIILLTDMTGRRFQSRFLKK